MDFAYGLATGISTGSGSSMVGAAIHDMNDSTSGNDKTQYIQAQLPSEPSKVMDFIGNVFFMMCIVGIVLFLLLIVALTIGELCSVKSK